MVIRASSGGGLARQCALTHWGACPFGIAGHQVRRCPGHPQLYTACS